MIYLHEIIDIIADGQQSYLDTVGERARHSQKEGISRLVGTWRVVGSTNRWPRVVNLWEMDSWEHWARTLERQFLPEKTDPALAPWWSRAAQWRSGGFDRILEPAAGSPTLAELHELQLRAWVCLQTITRTHPGKASAYLASLTGQLTGLLAPSGLSLLGAFRATMRSDEVLTIWAAKDFPTLCRFYERRNEDPALQSWGRESKALRREWESMFLVPSTDCFFHPLGEGRSKSQSK